MSFGGFSDIQRDRDRAHSSRHRNAGREEHEDTESAFARQGARTYWGRSEEEETEEETEEEEEERRDTHDANSHAPSNPRGSAAPPPREPSTNGVGVGWGSVAEAGIANFTKAYDKSAAAHKDAGSNGTGKSAVFGQRLAERAEPESAAGAGAGAGAVKQTFGSGESGFLRGWWCMDG